ncbi:ParB/RepB/Spo0J family partition protein [Paracoccus marinaquae]|uniref:ParB/RepB/Spo0J family partition protein n=1 Tax=Paracoccus marinaquae TaxID=2841926 RepID=A0ABS6AQ71_9RHOB|nr:ParB/RepB/Spo0J family partition protein [Paracoccus marinaquae]MBU3031780.1 ParB/RepB/Spo0J family partition protein [Paracoccus marinaquae]
MKQSSITTAPIQYFPLDALYLSDLNPRQEADPEGIDLLADSIAAVGLLQNLAGFADEAGKVGIVAGGRRLRALTRAFERHADLLDRRPELAEIPVRLTTDEATARAWASIENAAREDLHPADEIRAYGRMAEAGSDVPAIARVFAVTEAHVYRRLALAALPAPVLDALKAGEISLEAAKCFTVAQDEALALDILDRMRGQDVSAHRLKQLLQPKAIRATDRRAAYVGVDAYEGAGGPITRDLFGGEVFLGDADLLDRLFAEKLAMDAEAIGHGWKWVETSPDSWIEYEVTAKLDRIYRVEGDLTEEQAERYDELSELAEAGALDEEGQAELDTLETFARGDFTDAQREHAGLFIFVDSNGQLTVQAAYIRAEDREAAIAAEVLTGFAARSRDGGSGTEAAPKPAISNALRDDLNRVAKGARQHAALRDPELLIDLLAC